MKALPYNNLNIPYISLLYVYQELKYNKGMKTMKNNENKKIFLKYLEIKNINKDLINYDNFLSNDDCDFKTSLSICIIIKNEEKFIEKCIKSIIIIADEIIIVDTGSTDKTLSILNSLKKMYGNKINVYHYAWDENFSKARNYAMKFATSEWILFIDADEEWNRHFEKEELYGFLSTIALNEITKKIAFALKIKDYGTDIMHMGIPRLFRNDKIKYFFGNVHEELRLKEESLTIIQLNFEIVHYGYAANIMKSKNKIKRNLSLLEKVREIEPDNLRWIYFFIRDGKDVIDYETVTNLVNKYIKKDIGSERFEDNVVDNKYTYAILKEFCNYSMKNGNIKVAKELVDMLSIMNKDDMDVFYYKTLLEIDQIRSMNNMLLKRVITYRKNNFENTNSYISSSGYHIDFLLAILLFNIGKYNDAKKYFRFLENKIKDDTINELVKIYNGMLESLGEKQK